jgi:hypothetical protein
MAESDPTTTWWLWNATFDDQGHRVILEVRSIMAGDLPVHTPTGYFLECDSGSGIPDWMATRAMIDNEEFARLRAEGTIRPLTTTLSSDDRTKP